MTGTPTRAPTRTVVVPAGRWHLSGTGAQARFGVSNLGWRTVHGTLPVASAEVEVGPGGLVLRARAVAVAAGVDTGNPRRDADLRGPRFLRTDADPDLVLESTGPQPHADAAVPAQLRHGGSVAAAAVEVLELGPACDGGVSVRARVVVDLRELGIRAPRVLVGRRVTVDVRAVLVRGPG